MRLNLLLCVLVSLAATASTATPRRHRPALKGQIEGTMRGSQPVEPIIGQVLPPTSVGGSLVSHGNYLYALTGDRVYKLDPGSLRIVSVQQLTLARPKSKTEKPATKPRTRRRRVVEN